MTSSGNMHKYHMCIMSPRDLMKPAKKTVPTLLTCMLSSQCCSHGDVMEKDSHRSAGCQKKKQNWARAPRHLNTLHYLLLWHVRNENVRGVVSVCGVWRVEGGSRGHSWKFVCPRARSLTNFSFWIPQGLTFRCEKPVYHQIPSEGLPPPPAHPTFNQTHPFMRDLRRAVSCHLLSGSGSNRLFVDV